MQSDRNTDSGKRLLILLHTIFHKIPFIPLELKADISGRYVTNKTICMARYPKVSEKVCFGTAALISSFCFVVIWNMWILFHPLVPLWGYICLKRIERQLNLKWLCFAAGRVLTSLTNTIVTPDSENSGRTRRRRVVVSYKEPTLNRWGHLVSKLRPQPYFCIDYTWILQWVSLYVFFFLFLQQQN